MSTLTWPGPIASRRVLGRVARGAALLLAVAVALGATWLRADVALVAPAGATAGRTVLADRFAGTVVEFTGRELVLDVVPGGRRTFPAERVVRLEPALDGPHARAEAAFERRDYAAARPLFEAALAGEQRRWLRRLILARLVVCAREQGQWETAAELFAVLVADDPATPYFGAIPLPWTAVELSPAAEQKALAWLGRVEKPELALIGAAWLLSTPQRGRGLAELRALAGRGDPRIAPLAEAQRLRAELVTLDEPGLERFTTLVERLPESLAAGPTFTLARALAQRGQHESAAALLLRVRIVWPEESRLGAEALWGAAQALDKLGQSAEARRLDAELVREFPGSPWAAEARRRLESQP